VKYQVTQPKILNNKYYGVGDTIEDVSGILNVEVLIQNAVLIPVNEPVKQEQKVEDVKTPVNKADAKQTTQVESKTETK
jgi:hypothetical protein